MSAAKKRCLSGSYAARSLWAATGASGQGGWPFHPIEALEERLLLSAAPVTGEFFVNKVLPDLQISPAVAMAQDGGFVAVWQSRVEDGSGAGVFARRFDSSASP